jgi:protein TonB
VKRFFLAAALAVAFHGFLLGTTPSWLTKKNLPKQETRVVTLSLAYRQPITPRPKPAIQKVQVPLKRPLPIIKKEEKRPAPKPRPRPTRKVLRRSKTKSASIPLKPKKEHAPPKVVSDTPLPEHLPPETPKQPSASLPEVTEDILGETQLKETMEIASAPPVQAVREARPMYRENPKPEYPRLARRRAYQGTVVLEVLVDQEGRVVDLRVFASSGHQVLDRAAMKSVKTWLFEPGMRGDERVAMWVRIPIRFQLK